jgi:hypothetical protein
LEVGKLEKNFDLGKVGKEIGHILALVYAWCFSICLTSFATDVGLEP